MLKQKKKFKDDSSGIIKNKKVLALMYTVLTVAALAVILPLLWLFFTSLKTQADLTFNTWGLPKEWAFGNYIKAWVKSDIPLNMLNSIRTTIETILITVVLVTPVSFVLARFRFRGKNLLYMFFIAGMMVPIHSTIIPIYKLVGNVNGFNNLEILSLIYGSFRIPVSIFILEGFMTAIPKELEECAVIDGASVKKIFFRIIMPLSKDGIVTVAILTVLACWNELLVSMLLLSEPAKKTLPTGLMGFISEYEAQYTVLAAGIMLAIIPTIIFYALAQEQIEKGMIAGSVKG